LFTFYEHAAPDAQERIPTAQRHVQKEDDGETPATSPIALLKTQNSKPKTQNAKLETPTAVAL
jgi:hypothetical protein